MELIFLRHGVAVDQSDIPDLPNADRPLTDEGRAEVQRSAARFENLGIDPEVILTSPLPRARQTAEIVAVETKIDPDQLIVAEELSPGCTVETLSPLLGRYADNKQVMIVGHEPDFSQMISDLIGGGRIKLKKGGVARVDLPDTASKLQGKGVLRFLLTPKQMK